MQNFISINISLDIFKQSLQRHSLEMTMSHYRGAIFRPDPGAARACGHRLGDPQASYNVTLHECDDPPQVP